MLPVGIDKESKVVLFDGVCRLCSFWAKFLIRFDRDRIFKLATVQSKQGKEILNHCGLPTEYYETMVYVEDGKCFTRSTALLKILHQLPFPWPVLCVGWIFPIKIRDWLYDRVALNRYKLFGRYDSCMLPSRDHESRFLGGDK